MDTNESEVILVKDLSPGVTEYTPRFATTSIETPDSSSPSSLLEFNDKLYFNLGLARLGGRQLGFTSSGLYVSDGTADGTKLVMDIFPGADDSEFGDRYSSTSGLFEFNDKLYFSANNGEVGDELYVSDGTAEGTKLVADIYPGEDRDEFGYGSDIRSFVEFNDKLYFIADNGKNGHELYVSDGTAEGTKLVADIYPGKDRDEFGYGSDIRSFVEFNDKLYFGADNGKNEYGEVNSSDVSYLVVFNDKLYFRTYDENGAELYVSDGTAKGTQSVEDKDIDPGLNVNNHFVEFNDKFYFIPNSGDEELYVSDLTAEGTQLVKDINPGKYGYSSPYLSDPSDLVVFNDKLYFSADNGKNGEELYVSDGTATGTKLVADIYPGEDSEGYSYSSSPLDLTVVGDELFFSAQNGETGRELFKLTLGSEGEEILHSAAGDDLAAL